LYLVKHRVNFTFTFMTVVVLS